MSEAPLDDQLLAELLELASATAREAGELLEHYRRDTSQATMLAHAQTKSSQTDLATDADRASEDLIIGRILAERPTDGVVAEEEGAITGTSGVTWVIDPLDGTTNFVYGFAPYAVSIAAVLGEETICGVVYDPLRDELFRATAGQGADLNGAELPVRVALAPIGQALLGTGFSYNPAERARQARLLDTVLPAARDIRRAGAAAVDLCSLAAGRLDGYYESGLKAWDKAAGLLIARECGCRHGELHLHEFGPTLVVAPEPLFGAIVELLEAAARAL